MALAWIVLSSTAILMPRFYKSYLVKGIMGKPVWFRVRID